ncbi:MAG TPA: hypothetical protein VKQ30_20675 [Ktedonobacterales bacterium]|nr:hypothetical protein [Ktedonobacterales bacterium]
MNDLSYILTVEADSKNMRPEALEALQKAMHEAGCMVKMKVAFVSGATCSFKKWSAEFNPDNPDGYSEIPIEDAG